MKNQSKYKQYFKNPSDHPNFFQDVYDVVKLIPRGRVSTYRAIARYLGTGKSARMVGWALNVCHSLKDVPAHRVVNRMGVLTGKIHFSPPEKMENMLKREGVKVKEDQVLYFGKLFWDPGEELGV